MEALRETGDLDPTGLISRLVDVSGKAAAALAGNTLEDVPAQAWETKRSFELGQFFMDRLKVQFRDEGRAPDLVDAVLAMGDDDLVRIVERADALDAFLQTDDGANLLSGYKRAVNILKAEEKKGALPTGRPIALADAPAEETALLKSIEEAEGPIGGYLEAEDFEAAMFELSRLRAPVDAFFDKVLVNSGISEERENRLRLLAKVRDAMGQVADFSQVTG